jgi:hypothetical protein
MGPDESGVPQQAVTPVPDQVRDDGPGVHVEGLRVAGKRQFQKAIPKRSPPCHPEERSDEGSQRVCHRLPPHSQLQIPR